MSKWACLRCNQQALGHAPPGGGGGGKGGGGACMHTCEALWEVGSHTISQGMEMDGIASRIEQSKAKKEGQKAADDYVEELAAAEVLCGHRVEDQEQEG